MSDRKLVQWRHDIPIGSVDSRGQVILDQRFIAYLEDQRFRSGGTSALTNVELEQSALSSSLNVFSRGASAPQKSIVGDQFVQVTPSINRFTVSLDMDSVRAAIAPFIARQTANKQRPDDSQAILASRIFGAR